MTLHTALCRLLVLGLSVSACTVSPAQDIDDAVEHPMIARYPGQTIAWQRIENWRPYRVPVGPVTGYRAIGEWIETEGRVTRTFYTLDATERTAAEVFANYRDGLAAEGFELLAQRFSLDRRGNDVGSNAWITVAYAENALTNAGPARRLLAGSADQGGMGSIVAHKKRASGDAYVVITLEKDSAMMIGTLIDIIELAAVESGLVVVDAEAIGSDIDEYGRVVLNGISFEFNSATLRPESDAALDAMAEYLRANPEKRFYIVGHTDSVGTFAYNAKLSADRAQAVMDALMQTRNVASDRLEAHGVGPLAPVFSNSTESGREQNRRVELVERRNGE